MRSQPGNPNAEKGETHPAALITGGSSGIGLALARQLAQEGYHVWLIARGADRLAEALAQVKALCQSPTQLCGASSLDVSDYAQLESGMREIESQVGAPDLLINCAGVAEPGTFHETSVEILHQTMEINYFGTVHTIKAALPGMLKRGSGHIVNISSEAGYLGVYGWSAYAASKFALVGLSEALHQELKMHGIRVSIVYPPDVNTPQLEYETQRRPEITRIIMGGMPLLSAEAAAARILRSVRRRRFTIFLDLTGRAMYIAKRLVGDGYNLVLDILVANARRQIKKKNQPR